ncbi:MAG TPA: GFA family protein [Burkholderiaceae bacterium]|nr:GFA family protein [Burkholderiaceae bacterium]
MMKTYRGSCHCETVTFEADADLTQPTYRCNCSVCQRTRFWSAVVRPDGFRLLSGEAALTQYRFNSRKNVHYFCSICGVRPFCIGNGNDAHAGRMTSVNVMCLEGIADEELARIPVTYVDGRNDRCDSATTAYD